MSCRNLLENKMNRNKVRGMIIGGAIGDAWGMPVETWSPEKIREKYPDGITNFISPKDHKWFDASKTPAGSTTDDTQLTIATMKGLIAGHDAFKEGANRPFDVYMNAIAAAHCVAFKTTTDGWGHTTRDAIRRLCNGLHWSVTAESAEGRGTGNGVPMKCSPLSAWHAVEKNATIKGLRFPVDCVAYSAMTHLTQMSALATLCHVNAVEYCLKTQSSSFITDDFLKFSITDVWAGLNKTYSIEHLDPQKDDDIHQRMLLLISNKENIPSMEQAEIIETFGNGSCYVFDSLPFSYAWFLKNHWSISSLQDVVEAGGDTDTTAKIVGEMIGALNGYESIKTSIPWVIEGLVQHDELLALSDEFCRTFGVE